MYIPHSVTDRRTDRQTQCSYYCTQQSRRAVKNRLRMSVTAKINPSTTHTVETTALRSFDTSTVWLMEYYYKTQCIHGRKNTQDFFIFTYLFIFYEYLSTWSEINWLTIRTWLLLRNSTDFECFLNAFIIADQLGLLLLSWLDAALYSSWWLSSLTEIELEKNFSCHCNWNCNEN